VTKTSGIVEREFRKRSQPRDHHVPGEGATQWTVSNSILSIAASTLGEAMAVDQPAEIVPKLLGQYEAVAFTLIQARFEPAKQDLDFCDEIVHRVGRSVRRLGRGCDPILLNVEHRARWEGALDSGRLDLSLPDDQFQP
jgi:hypothetical protein